ncbi:MAG: hypothetical protein JJ863_07655 [Deltaproteobacteria bacterium]|nr:hypothetical protein [Deltaproteobacteria bacterium]
MKRCWMPMLLLAAFGCGEDAPQIIPRHAVTFTAESDPGVPLAGVVVSANGQALGQSDATGLIGAVLEGPSGTMMQIAYECPEGHQQPEQPKSLVLTTFQALDPESGPRALEMNLECPPLERWAALVVRTGQPDLPILIEDEEVARTDGSGVAHHIFRGAPNSRYRVTISTEGKPNLQPQNPRALVTLGARSETFVIEEEIRERQVRRRRRTRRRASAMRGRMSIMRIIRIN